MAFRIIRQRKEARRNAKLDEIFEVTICYISAVVTSCYISAVQW